MSTASESTPPPRPPARSAPTTSSPRGARLHRRAAPPLRAAPPGAARRPARARGRAAGGRDARLPRGDARDPRGRLAGRRRRRRLRSTAASRSPARPTASSSSTRSTRAPRASWPTSRTPTAPTWENVVVGHVNLIDAIDRTITYDASDGKHYELERGDRDAARAPARLAPRRQAREGRGHRGLRAACSTSASTSSTTPSGCSTPARGPYFYLPKMEHHLEARLWNDVLGFAEEAARRPPGHDRARPC